MNRSTFVWCLAGLLWLGLPWLQGVVSSPGAPRAEAQPTGLLKMSLPQRAIRLLSRWRPDEAEQVLKPLLLKGATPQSIQLILGRIRYYQGRYREGLAIYEKAANKDYLKRSHMYNSMKQTLEVTKNYRRVESPHFIISYPPGKERILVTYAIEALEKAYARFHQLFQFSSKSKIRIEILKDSLDLAKMSPLTEKDIMTTGTIALCKYNRIMLTSPRALLRGYRWLDTLVHEFMHLVINRITAGIPIWLHEGLARYGETLWRTKNPPPLSPYSESLLATALQKDKLVTFQQMHPSMAKLPSQKHAALAYAQVYMLVLYFVTQAGTKGIRKVLEHVHEGMKLPQAFANVLQIPFDEFLQNWKAHLKKKKLRTFPGLIPPKKILKGKRPSSRPAEKKKDFWSKPTKTKEKGKRFLKLGEMLRGQGRSRAAITEYKKAATHLKNLNPNLQRKMAKAYFQLNLYKEALGPIRWSLEMYPNFFPNHYLLGKAYFGLKEFDKALEAFEIANSINPFHPRVHHYLMYIYKHKGKKRLLQREFRIQQMLQQPED